MNFICAILFSYIFLLSGVNILRLNERVAQGTYIISANLINKKGSIVNLINADSLFVYKHLVAEAKMKLKIVEMDGIELPRKNIREGFYLINLQRGAFAELEDLKTLKKIQFKLLSEKKSGFDFGGGKGLFHNETYSVENSTYEGKKVRKISYIIKGGPYNDKHIIIYVSDFSSPNQPIILYPEMEKTFKGSIKEMRIDLEDQAVLVVHCSFSQEIKKEYLQRLITLSNIIN